MPEPENVIRPPSEWTPENPANRMEIEAELEKYRGQTITYGTWGGAYTDAENRAYFDPIN